MYIRSVRGSLRTSLFKYPLLTLSPHWIHRRPTGTPAKHAVVPYSTHRTSTPACAPTPTARLLSLSFAHSSHPQSTTAVQLAQSSAHMSSIHVRIADPTTDTHIPTSITGVPRVSRGKCLSPRALPSHTPYPALHHDHDGYSSNQNADRKSTDAVDRHALMTARSTSASDGEGPVGSSEHQHLSCVPHAKATSFSPGGRAGRFQ